jgi:hypothetical protein
LLPSKVLVDHSIEVDYGQLYVESFESAGADTDAAFAGQRNGLAGAGVPGFLFLVTGLRNGPVDFTAQRHSAEPPLEDGWEDIVEVSFTALSADVAIRQWDGTRYELDLAPGDYRVRYNARGMQQAWQVESIADGNPIDAYLLQFWSAPRAADQIIRLSSDVAAYWHQQNTGTLSVTPEAPNDLRRRPIGARDPGSSGERAPDVRLAAVNIYLGDIKALDQGLMIALAGSDDATHHAVARWAALQALKAAAMTDLPSLSPVFTALRDAATVPAPFNDEIDATVAVGDLAETTVPQIEVLRDDSDADPVQQLNAILAVVATARADSLAAALDAVVLACITFGENRYRGFLTRLRETFPNLEPNR